MEQMPVGVFVVLGAIGLLFSIVLMFATTVFVELREEKPGPVVLDF